MKFKEPKELKRCEVCKKPISHFNESGLCLKHNALRMQKIKMQDPDYRARHNLQRKILYHTKILEQLEYEKKNWVRI